MFEIAKLHVLIDAGTVKSQRHPTEPLTIYNYTPACQYDRRWCPISTACRGLILHDDGRVIARPFPKFFNMDEHSRSDICFTKPFMVTEKMDGSLGVLYSTTAGSSAIATRGSFTSAQARWATGYLHAEHHDFRPAAELTYLFEIIYPDNRIVVDYGARRELILLAVIETATGRDIHERAGWNGPVVRHFDVSCKPRDVLSTLQLADDGNSEGVVLCFDWPKTGPKTRVKVKLDEYKRLHRLLYATSTKTVWEALSSGGDLTDLQTRVPDEFHAWLRTTVAGMQEQYQTLDTAARSLYAEILESLPTGFTRKEFAERAVPHREKALLFCLLDGASIDSMLWKQIEPDRAVPFRQDNDS